MINQTNEILITEEQIKKRVDELGSQITKDYAGEEVLLVGILKGSVPFMADLMRRINLDVEIDFMSVSSYGAGTTSSGEVKIKKDLDDEKMKDITADFDETMASWTGTHIDSLTISYGYVSKEEEPELSEAESAALLLAVLLNLKFATPVPSDEYDIKWYLGSDSGFKMEQDKNNYVTWDKNLIDGKKFIKLNSIKINCNKIYWEKGEL